MAITPKPGYMVDPNNPNAVIPIGSAAQAQNLGVYSAPATAPKVSPAPQPPIPSAPAAVTPSQYGTMVGGSLVATPSSTTPNETQNPTSATTAASTSSVASATPPSESGTSSVAGAAGPGVQGLTTPPTPSVADILAASGGQSGQSTGGTASQTSAIAQKYTSFAASMSGSAAPSSNPMNSPEVQQKISGDATQQDPQQALFNAYSSMNPIVQQLYNTVTQTMSPQNTAQNFTQEYQTLTAQAGIPGIQTQLLNIQNVMNGTTDDIRSEITASGGFATDSQVMAMSAARNNVLMKQANTLQSTLQMQQQYVSQVMQFSQADQQEVDTQVNEKTGVLETMATLQNTMQQNTVDMYNNVVKNGGGYTTLANSLTALDPSGQQLAYASQLLGANLSSPAWIAQADEYNSSKISLEQAKATTALYNNTLMGDPTTGTYSTGTYGTATTTISQMTGINPNTPLSNVDPTALLPAILKNEGGSLPGVQNNPGNIKFVGLPGQTDSGVKAADGGTFANYKTPKDGQAAVLNDIQAGMSNNPSQTLGQFIDKYTNTAPKQKAVGTTGNPAIDPTVPGYTSNNVVGGMTQAAIDQAALQYATSGTLPTGARSSTGAGLAMSSAIKNRAAEMDATGNISANKANLSALTSSLNTQTDYLTSTQRALTGADNSFNQILAKFQSSGINDQSMPIANIFENYTKYGLGTSQLPAFKASLADLGNEYQQVFSRGGQVTDAVRKTSNDIIDGNISLSQLADVNTQLQTQGKIVVAAAQSEVTSINGQISNIVTGGVQGVSKGSMSNNDFVNHALSSNNISYNQAVSSVPNGEVGVIDNSTGQFGSIPPSEYDPSLYTEI